MPLLPSLPENDKKPPRNWFQVRGCKGSTLMQGLCTLPPPHSLVLLFLHLSTIHILHFSTNFPCCIQMCLNREVSSSLFLSSLSDGVVCPSVHSCSQVLVGKILCVISKGSQTHFGRNLLTVCHLTTAGLPGVSSHCVGLSP